ncbi:MAG: hypothetical protein M1821_006371 [Bathelium mastoideum]|nr:MAG: hypothetical protein M1821_006371 [Bathelium mastoideum]
MAGVPDWKLIQLDEYETSQRHPEGLKASEKLLRKYPGNAYLLPPIIHEAVLAKIYGTLARALNDADPTSLASVNDLNKLWQSAIDSQPQRKASLYNSWIAAARFTDRWEDIQYAVQQAQRAFRNQEDMYRYYYFYGLVAGSFVSTLLQATNPLKSRTIAALTMKRIQKSIENTLASSSGSAAERPIKSSTELQLVYQLYRTHGQAEPIYDLVRNPVLGRHSSLGQGEFDLAKQTLETLKQKEKWGELKAYIESILFQSAAPSEMQTQTSMGVAPEADLEKEAAQDVALWDHYVESVTQLGAFDHLPPEMMGDSKGEAAATRGRALARCKLLSKLLDLLESSSDSEVKGGGPLDFESIFKHLGLGDAPSQVSGPEKDLRRQMSEACAAALRTTSQTWFEDMKPFLEGMSGGERTRVKDAVGELGQFVDSATAEVISLKLDYLWCGSEEALIGIVKKGLQLASAEAHRRNRSDEVFLLLAVGLIRLHVWVERQPHRSQTMLLLALRLLQFVQEVIPASSQGVAILVRLAHYLGFWTPLLVHWDKLRVKNVLVDPLGYLVVERVSITQPQTLLLSYGSQDPPKFEDPADLLYWLLEEFAKNEKQVDDAIKEALQRGSWDAVFDLSYSLKKLRQSITLRTALLERRRIFRLRDEGYDCLSITEDKSKWLPNVDISDSRDTNVLLNYEPSGERPFYQHISNGPLPGVYWIKFYTMIDEVDCILTEQKTRTLTYLSGTKYSTFVIDDEAKCRAEFTDAEFASVRAWQAIQAIVAHLDQDAKEAQTLKSLLKGLAQSLDHYEPASDTCIFSVNDKPLLPDARRLQAFYIDLDLFDGCSKVVSFVSKKTKNEKQYGELVQGIRQKVQKLHSRNMAMVKGWAEKLEGYDLGKQLREDELGLLVGEALGNTKLEAKSKQYVRDAVHALSTWEDFGEKVTKKLA